MSTSGSSTVLLASTDLAAEPANGYAKYSSYANQHSASSSSGSTGTSQSAQDYEKKYSSSANQNHASSGSSSTGATKNAQDYAQYVKTYAPAYAKYTTMGTSPKEKSGSQLKGTALLAQTADSTDLDAEVKDLEDKIEALKRNEDYEKKYVPQEYQDKVLSRSKNERAALEDKLKAAKQDAREAKKAEERADANKVGDKKGGAASGASMVLLAQTKDLTELDAEVKDLEGKIEALKRNEDYTKKYVPQEYRDTVLSRSKSERAALEDKLMAAKQDAMEAKKDEERADANKTEDKKGMSTSGSSTVLLASTDLAAEPANGYAKYSSYANQHSASSSSGSTGTSQSAQDYEKKYSSSANQQSASSGSSSTGASRNAQDYEKKYSSYANQNHASSGSSSTGATKNAQDYAQYVKTYAPAYAKYTTMGTSPKEKSGSQLKGTALLAQTADSTDLDAEVKDLEDKIEALKRNEDYEKKYVPQEYQDKVLSRSKNERAALEDKLKAAKQEAREAKQAEERAAANKTEDKN